MNLNFHWLATFPFPLRILINFPRFFLINNSKEIKITPLFEKKKKTKLITVHIFQQIAFSTIKRDV